MTPWLIGGVLAVCALMFLVSTRVVTDDNPDEVVTDDNPDEPARPRVVLMVCHACRKTERVPGGHFTDEMVGGWGDKLLCADCRAKGANENEKG